MAERRMFTKTIIDSDAFLDLPLSTQALYFHLSMRADDDGFLNNPKKIMRMTGASQSELETLIARNFLIGFETGVIVIKHWKLHNYIRKDRYTSTVYKDEKALIYEKENKVYTKDKNKAKTKELEDGIPDDIPMVDHLDTQVRLGKVRLGKVSKEKEITVYEGEESKTIYENIFDYYITLGLIKHKEYKPVMKNAMQKAEKAYKLTFEEMKILLQRHKTKVDSTKNSEYPTKIRTLTEFFGQKKFNSTDLICGDYLDEVWELEESKYKPKVKKTGVNENIREKVKKMNAERS